MSDLRRSVHEDGRIRRRDSNQEGTRSTRRPRPLLRGTWRRLAEDGMTICAACGDLADNPVIVRGLLDEKDIVEVRRCCLDEVLIRMRLRPVPTLREELDEIFEPALETFADLARHWIEA